MNRTNVVQFTLFSENDDNFQSNNILPSFLFDWRWERLKMIWFQRFEWNLMTAPLKQDYFPSGIMREVVKDNEIINVH